jgi:uncharacterized membrane protein
LIVAISLTVLVTATAFTVDLGRVSTERRDLQKVADVAALDLSRRLDGRTASQIVADPAWQAALDASLSRNDFPRDTAHTVTVALGSYDVTGEVFTPATGTQVPSAVRVALGAAVDYEFAPGGTTATRTAIAGQTASAGHQVGSFAARLDSDQSALLGALVGDALGVTVAGYEGLVGGRVRLPLLLEELDLTLGSADEVLGTEVTVLELIRAEAEVLRRTGDLVRADLLDALALTLPSPDAIVRLDELLAIVPGGEAAAALATIDAADLLNATALIANGTNLLNIPSASIAVGGDLAAVTTSVQVIESPRWAFGPVGTAAHTAQTTIELVVKLTVPEVSDTTIRVRAQLAPATARSAAIGCRGTQTLDIDVNTGLLTTRADIASRLSAGGLPLADVDLHAATSAPADTTAIGFDLPPDVFGEPRQVPTPATSLGTAEVVTDRIDVIGIPLDVLIGPLVDGLVSTVVSPLLTAVETTVLRPLAQALGLTVGGADVAPLAVTCSGPKLIG